MSHLFDQPTSADERPKAVILDQTPPSTTTDWASFVCPDQARQIFRTSSNPHCINTHSITKQARLQTSLIHFSLHYKVYHLWYCLRLHFLFSRGCISQLYRIKGLAISKRGGNLKSVLLQSFVDKKAHLLIFGDQVKLSEDDKALVF